jgi:hypothetical protein
MGATGSHIHQGCRPAGNESLSVCTKYSPVPWVCVVLGFISLLELQSRLAREDPRVCSFDSFGVEGVS